MIYSVMDKSKRALMSWTKASVHSVMEIYSLLLLKISVIYSNTYFSAIFQSKLKVFANWELLWPRATEKWSVLPREEADWKERDRQY